MGGYDISITIRRCHLWLLLVSGGAQSWRHHRLEGGRNDMGPVGYDLRYFYSSLKKARL